MLVTIIVLVLAIGIAGASLYFYNVAISRTDKSFLNGNPDLEVGASAENPYERNDQWWDSQSFEDWSLQSEDGLRLHAYYLEAKLPSGVTVIIAHGYSGHAALMTNFAQMYSEKLGYNVLLPDARGHGRSEGGYIGFGWPERRDYVGWIRKVVERNGEKSQIILHGVSMGGATVMMTSGEPLPHQVKAIIEDCGYTSAREQLAYQLKRMYKLPSFPLLLTTSLVTKWRAGYSFSEASAIKQVRKSKTPILFIHGDTDLFVPTAMVNELYEQGPEQKELLIIPGAGHGLARHTDPDKYDRTVIGFIQKHIQ